MTILCWQVEGFVEGFVGFLSALYCSLDNQGCHRMCCFADMFDKHLSSMRFRSVRMMLSLD